MRFLPQRLTSKIDPELAAFLNDLLAEIRSLKPLSSPSVGFNRTANGFTAQAKVNPPGGNAKGILTYRGTYDPTKSYNQFDIVRVQTGTSQGVWISVSPTPLLNDPPVFPEPVTVGGANKWEMWSFGVQASVNCQGGSATVFVQASGPIT